MPGNASLFLPLDLEVLMRVLVLMTAIVGIGVMGCAADAAQGQATDNGATDVAKPEAARTLDGFEQPETWKVVTADGVSLKMSADAGRDGTGKSARLDYDFSRGSGYAIIRKRFDLPLTENYRFSYFVRGEGPRNTMEFKLVDPSGDNVWWVNRRDYEWPREWTKLTLPKRKIEFAWGPAGSSALLKTAGFVEIVVTSSSGGKGTVWLDDLEFEQLPEVKPYAGTPLFTGLNSPTIPLSTGAPPAKSIGAQGQVGWTSLPEDERPRMRVDFGQAREIGGMVIGWDAGYAVDYDVLASADGERFEPAAQVRGSNGGRDYIQLPDATARAIEIRVLGRHGGGPVTLESVLFEPPEFGDSANALLTRMAADSPRGRWPRAMRGEAVYWTVVGADGDTKEALISEDGAVEVDKLGFSLEPFIFEGGALRTWADGTSSQKLEEGYLPIPSVTRADRGLELEVKAFAAGNAGESNLFVRYELRNASDAARAGKLFVAMRPMQVNPPYQNLNITGGAAVVKRIRVDRGAIAVDDRIVMPLTRIDGFGATTIDGGELVEHLALGHPPMNAAATDPHGLCSGALEYAFELAPGAGKVVSVMVPFHGNVARGESADVALEATRAYWRERLNRVRIKLPRGQERIADSVRANLAYILINRDGPGLQPGSRCYERTWIRDGALTSSAMLALGLEDEVKAFLDWFAPFQYDNGKVPCCVDTRGPDAVPEHDSHGEYIAAVRTCFDFTGDSDFLKRHWPRVLKATEYIEFLRKQRMTDEFAKGSDEKRVLYGLMPESISHEGYSAKPMHSYWDDFWTLKGLRDAAHVAALVGERSDAARLDTLARDFARTLNDSIALAIRIKKIDYVPGCAELGDFDATSTTIAMFPCEWEPGDLRPQLDATFDRYWAFFTDRRDGKLRWKDYTPYEHRVVGSMVMLGHRGRALDMFDFFFGDQRPQGWRHWAEVVRKDPREQGYIGDMPHTWCGSDYINSVRTMLAYRRERDDAMVIGAGLPRAWLEDAEGVAVSGLRTEWGALTFSAKAQAASVALRVDALERTPPGGVWISLPDPDRIASVRFGESDALLGTDGLYRLPALPASLRIEYRK